MFKNGATTQVLRKLRILTKFGLCYIKKGAGGGGTQNKEN